VKLKNEVRKVRKVKVGVFRDAHNFALFAHRNCLSDCFSVQSGIVQTHFDRFYGIFAVTFEFEQFYHFYNGIVIKTMNIIKHSFYLWCCCAVRFSTRGRFPLTR
jgi:hypothetical protein